MEEPMVMSLDEAELLKAAGENQEQLIFYVLNILSSHHLNLSRYPKDWNVSGIIQHIDETGDAFFHKASNHAHIAKLFLVELQKVESIENGGGALTVKYNVIDKLAECKTSKALKDTCRQLDQQYETELSKALSMALLITKKPFKCSFWKAGAALVVSSAVITGLVYDYKHDGKTKPVWDAIVANPQISAPIGAVILLALACYLYCRSKAAVTNDEKPQNLVPNNAPRSSMNYIDTLNL
jgi:hypothetical protein